ncbi:hypothetical protein BZG06_10495 [Salinivibrio kushneri]|uniref:DUF2523 family protein n=1 Tax=Salinivibrio kushneri TaxID=1908198 RepID=UPI000988711B|nr:DUF2523 family protein [Salinivibrio kushneri]OOE43761.1 hypothetical protein BZG06_10495 [Salinivibrio kushneri]
MPAVFYYIGAFLLSIAPQLIKFFTAHAAVALGFSLVAFTGLHIGLDQLTQYIQDNIVGLPADMSAVLGLLGLDTGINIILSTMVWIVTYKGLSGTRSYRSAWRKPGSAPGSFGA